MEVKITPFNITGEQGQVIEFNIPLCTTARTDIAQQSNLSASVRYSVVYNAGTEAAPVYRQVTKLELVHTLMFASCESDCPQALLNRYSTIVDFAVTSNAVVPVTPTIIKVVDTLIPSGAATVNQAVLADIPTTLPKRSNCSYSVFTLTVPDVTAAPAA